MIYETIISTLDAHEKPHVTPFGVRRQEDFVIISPFKPSTTLDNIYQTQTAVMNLTDDVRIFAGAVARKPVYQLTPATHISGVRLENALAHHELVLDHVVEDDVRPQLWMRTVYQAIHGPFAGFNRAQAAVIEMAVLVSRLHMLPKEKVIAEQAYLKIAIDKTAGDCEREAWQWLLESVENFYAQQDGSNQV